MCVPEGLLYKSKTKGNDMFTKNLHNLFLKVPEPQTNSCKKEKNKQTTNNKKTVCFYKSKGDVVTSRCHGKKTSGSEQPLVLRIW